jgi:hypothetical protein
LLETSIRNDLRTTFLSNVIVCTKDQIDVLILLSTEVFAIRPLW